MRLDIMCDIETLGNKVDSTIFQISACAFDINTGEIKYTFNEIADISRDENLKVTGSTLKWWLNTNKELFSNLLNSGDGSSNGLLISFYDWLLFLKNTINADLYLWGNGILFDNKMIEHQLTSIGRSYPIFYRNDRDMRTLVELASHKIGIETEKEFRDKYRNKDLVEHDAFDDVKAQIDILVKARNIILQH